MPSWQLPISPFNGDGGAAVSLSDISIQPRYISELPRAAYLVNSAAQGIVREPKSGRRAAIASRGLRQIYILARSCAPLTKRYRQNAAAIMVLAVPPKARNASRTICGKPWKTILKVSSTPFPSKTCSTKNSRSFALILWGRRQNDQIIS